jgi:hypothetical protein
MSSSTSSPSCALLSLPLELLLKIHEYLDARDIAHLHRTCHALHVHSHNEHVFAPLCARYGLHRDSISDHSKVSFYVIYTKLLHAFGPLLGLYASDKPYQGSILSLRLYELWPTPNQPSEGPGIVGELWAFPQNTRLDMLLRGESDPWKIDHPLPRPMFNIRIPSSAISSTSTSTTSETDADVDANTDSITGTKTDLEANASFQYASVTCVRQAYGEAPHSAVLGLSPRDLRMRSICLRIRDEPGIGHTHPDFPPASAEGDSSSPSSATYTSGSASASAVALAARAAWHDPHREYHEVKPLTDVVFPSWVTKEDVLRRLDSFRRGFYFDELDTESEVMAHPHHSLRHSRFMSIQCPCFSADSPDDALLGPTRYYPLTSSASRPPPRGTQLWTPPAHGLAREHSEFKFDASPLAGLWLGDYGPHGTEVLYMDVDASGITEEGDRPRLRATKITGDFNVPRGVQTWEADLDAEIGREELMPGVPEMLRLDGDGDERTEGAEEARVFSGWATISDAGFTCVVISIFCDE